MTGQPTRYDLWVRARPFIGNERYSAWCSRMVRAFALAKGYKADPSLSRGVVVRTQTEAARMAIAREGHKALDAWISAHIDELEAAEE